MIFGGNFGRKLTRTALAGYTHKRRHCMEKKTYEKGVEDGVKLAKRKALEIITECERLTAHDYIEIRNAIREITAK